MLLFDDAERPLSDLDAVLGFLKVAKARRVTAEIQTASEPLLTQLVGRETVSYFHFERTWSLEAATAITDYARTRKAGYLDARTIMGCALRVWPDRIWVDNLIEEPKVQGFKSRPGREPGTVRFDLRTTNLEDAIGCWLRAAPVGRMLVSASNAPLEGIPMLCGVAAPEAPPIIKCQVTRKHALAFAAAHPTQSWAIQAENVEIELPSRMARVWYTSSSADTRKIRRLRKTIAGLKGP